MKKISLLLLLGCLTIFIYSQDKKLTKNPLLYQGFDETITTDGLITIDGVDKEASSTDTIVVIENDTIKKISTKTERFTLGELDLSTWTEDTNPNSVAVVNMGKVGYSGTATATPLSWTQVGDSLQLDTLIGDSYMDTIPGDNEVSNEIGDTLDARFGGAGELSDIVSFLTDSMTLFVFGNGRGILADTATFVDGMEVGSFFQSQDSLEVNCIESWLGTGSGTETLTFQIYFGDDYGSADDSLFTAPQTITSLTGERDTPNNETTIPPRQKVWGIIRGVTAGNIPALFRSNLIVYTKRE